MPIHWGFLRRKNKKKWNACSFIISRLNLKGSIFLKNRRFIIQERLNKLIYGTNTIIKCGTCKISVSLSFMKWNNFYRISKFMLVTLIQRYDIRKIISFFIQFKRRGANWNITGCRMPHFMIVLILYINLLNISWIRKYLFLRNMEPLSIFNFATSNLLAKNDVPRFFS